MTTGQCADYYDDVAFQCIMSWRKKSERVGTFSTPFRLIQRKLTLIVVNWMIRSPVKLTENFADVTEASAVQWYEYCEDICAIRNMSWNQSLGETGGIKEINETVVGKHKFSRGRGVRKEWISHSSLNILSRFLIYMKEDITNAPEINEIQCWH